MDKPLSVVIASPLERSLVARIRSAEPDRVEVVFEPDLLPVPRYEGDHDGIPRELDTMQLERWRSIVRDADVLFDFDWLAPASLPHAAPRLRWIQATSSGIGEYLQRTGLAASDIVFTTAAGVHGVALAEFVLLGMLYFTKRVPDLTSWQRSHHWQRYTTNRLAGSQVLLVGLGGVGRTIATRLDAMGVTVTGLARTPPPNPLAGVARTIRRDELPDVLRSTDAIVLACPYTPETHHLIAAPEIAALPPEAIIVNVARGSVIDEHALIAALRSGSLRGAALDVFEEEPLPADSPLWDMPNVLISPHSASTVGGENDLLVDLFIDNLRRHLEGRPLRNRYDPTRGY